MHEPPEAQAPEAEPQERRHHVDDGTRARIARKQVLAENRVTDGPDLDDRKGALPAGAQRQKRGYDHLFLHSGFGSQEVKTLDHGHLNLK